MSEALERAAPKHLPSIDALRNKLARIQTPQDAIHVRDEAGKVRDFLKLVGESVQACNPYAEIYMEAEWVFGDFIKDVEGGRPGKLRIDAKFSGNKDQRHYARRFRRAVEQSDIKEYVRLATEQVEQASISGCLQWLREMNCADLQIAPIVAPPGKFHVLVIDPPWPMERIQRELYPNQGGFDYPVLDVEGITRYEHDGRTIPDFAMDDAHIFMWTTHRFLPSAFDIFKAWKMKYVCTLVWHKPGGFQPYGLPQYNCEFILYGRQGNPSFIETKDFMCCFTAARQEHSRKPDAFYDVLRRVTMEPRIDMFAREPRIGFEVLGNEATKFA